MIIITPKNQPLYHQTASTNAAKLKDNCGSNIELYLLSSTVLMLSTSSYSVRYYPQNKPSVVLKLSFLPLFCPLVLSTNLNMTVSMWGEEEVGFSRLCELTLVDLSFYLHKLFTYFSLNLIFLPNLNAVSNFLVWNYQISRNTYLPWMWTSRFPALLNFYNKAFS